MLTATAVTSTEVQQIIQAVLTVTTVQMFALVAQLITLGVLLVLVFVEASKRW